MVMGELRRSFSPEFLNHIDEIVVVFHPLEKDHQIHIPDIPASGIEPPPDRQERQHRRRRRGSTVAHQGRYEPLCTVPDRCVASSARHRRSVVGRAHQGPLQDNRKIR